MRDDAANMKSFYGHNRIKSIFQMAKMVSRLFLSLLSYNNFYSDKFLI